MLTLDLGAAMDKDQKVLDLIAEYEAEALRCTRMAERLREVLSPGASQPAAGKHVRSVVIQPPKTMHTNGEQMSTIAAAVTSLIAHGEAMHVSELVPIVSNIRGTETPRSSIESVLSRAVKERKHGLMRTGPGMFLVRK